MFKSDNVTDSPRRVLFALTVTILLLILSACGNFTWSERMEVGRAALANCPIRHFWDGESCQPWKDHPTLKDKIPQQR